MEAVQEILVYLAQEGYMFDVGFIGLLRRSYSIFAKIAPSSSRYCLFLLIVW